MTEERSSYRQIMKATSIFGGVQVFNVIISIIKSKVVAVLLGPAGMGIAGLLTSTTELIGRFSNLGLSTSAVRNVAAAHASGDSERISTVVTVLRRLVWGTGLAGAVFTLFLAPWLSELTFGNKEYTLAFRLIAITLLLAQINAGQLVVLQGMRKLKYLANANIAGNTFALVAAVPVYYFWGLKGIVPVIILGSFLNLFFSWFYSSKVDIKSRHIDRSSLFTEGADMVKMGFFLSLSSILSMATSYIVRVFISHRGGVEQVGLYTAGFALINNYVGMVFTAMSTDYFPRLSGVANDNAKAKNIINQQAEIALLILAPILTIFLIFINYLVILLFSQKFVPVNTMIHWAALGIYFKAASWPISYLFIAKGDTKLFFYNELASKIYFTGFNILGYLWHGLDGLGVSYLAGFTIYFLQVTVISRNKYSFSFERAFYRIFIIQFLLGVLCFLMGRFLDTPYIYVPGAIVIFISSLYSMKELDKRLQLIKLIKDKFGKDKRAK